MRVVDIITKKRDGFKLSKEEIDYIVGLLIAWIKKETKIF